MMLFLLLFFLAFYKDSGVHSTHLAIPVVQSGDFSCLLPICAICVKKYK